MSTRKEQVDAYYAAQRAYDKAHPDRLDDEPLLWSETCLTCNGAGEVFDHANNGEFFECADCAGLGRRAGVQP